MPKVKICGNTNIEDAALAAGLGADYLGFIFAESKRKVETAQALEIRKALPDFENFVAVFFNQPKQEVEEIVTSLGISFIQFHGDETSLYCKYFEDKGFKVIKTFRIKDSMSLKRIDEYNLHAFLFDTYSAETKGGTGVPFDWNLIEDRPYVHESLFLAGGLNVDNLEEAIRRVKPFAVDVASGVEKQPGKKDPVLLERFIEIAKKGETDHVPQSSLHS